MILSTLRRATPERKAPSTLFEKGDGFDVYVDGARFLPDCVALSRVSVSILTSEHNAGIRHGAAQRGAHQPF